MFLHTQRKNSSHDRPAEINLPVASGCLIILRLAGSGGRSYRHTEQIGSVLSEPWETVLGSATMGGNGMQERDHSAGALPWPTLDDDEQTEPRHRELRALLELTERLLRAADANEVATVLLHSVVTTHGFARGTVLAATEQRQSVLATHAVSATAIRPGASVTVDRAFDEQTTQIVRRLSDKHEPWLTQLLPPESRVAVVPMMSRDRRLGSLVLELPLTLRGQHSQRVLQQVERAAHNASFALSRVQRLGQLTRLASTDDLTMIANRRSFTAALEREIARSMRSGQPLSLVLLDIDHFKQINDVHGHPAGDEALRNVAAALSIACRDLDTPARYGGEEFAVILPDCGVGRSVDIANRLRAAVAAAPASIPLTASAGVATFPAHACDSDQLIQAADDALLRAKRSGRDCTMKSSGIGDSNRVSTLGPSAGPLTGVNELNVPEQTQDHR